MSEQRLPVAAGATVLACGAWLKNTACLMQAGKVHWSPLHGDLGDPDSCIKLEQSVEALLSQAKHRIDAVAHDLHPDFFSTQLAQNVAGRLGVPAVAVQHHHAHIAAVSAEHGLQEPVIGLALDGVGLGTDGVAWGGELLWVDGSHWQRLGHFQTIALPGGDTAAREPWRMAASVLHALGRDKEIEGRFGERAGAAAAQTVHAMLARNLNCPPATGAGRWFDAAAGALGISVRQAFEAEAAMALENLAVQYLGTHAAPPTEGMIAIDANGDLDLRTLFTQLFSLADAGDDNAIARGAALFHVALADTLAEWAADAATRSHTRTIALGGGCFFNRVLTTRLRAGLERRNLQICMPGSVSCGDAGLALGQAWVVAHQLSAAPSAMNEANLCV